MGMFDKLPQSVKTAIAIVRIANPWDYLRIVKSIVYLWREFYVRTRIDVVIKEFDIQFYYKDDNILRLKTSDIRDISKLVDDLKKTRGEHLK